MKIKELPGVPLEHVDYAQGVAEAKSALGVEKKPKVAIQSASTLAAMERHADPAKMSAYLDYINSEEYAQKVKAKVYTEEELIERMAKTYGFDQISHLENTRRRPKNSVGQSEKSSSSDERKELARQAYMSTPGKTYEELSPQEREKIVQLQKLEKPPTPVFGPPIPKSIFDKVKEWLSIRPEPPPTRRMIDLLDPEQREAWDKQFKEKK